MEVTNNYLYNNSTTGYNNKIDTNNSYSSDWGWSDFIYQTTPCSKSGVLPANVYGLSLDVSRPSTV
jgi:hypothetical protein